MIVCVCENPRCRRYFLILEQFDKFDLNFKTENLDSLSQRIHATKTQQKELNK